MMRLIYVFIALVVGLALAPAVAARQVTGSGASTTETRSAGGFHGISLGVDAALEIRQGAAEGLTITGDDNIVPLVETVVESGVLKVRWTRGDYSATYKGLRIVVDVKALDSVALGGNGSIHAATLATPALAAKLGGSGSLVIDRLDAKSAAITSAGSGSVTLAGRADTLELTLAGSGEIDAAKLEAQTVRATVHGSAQASVWAKQILQATVAGSGDVRYYGRPQVTRTIAGSGSVSKAGDAP